MVEISAKLVQELREATNVGMMECKRALVEAGGDKDKAIRLLRERGLAIAAKKASRAANQGLVGSVILDGGKVGTLVEVNCETDFVARNESFKAFVAEVAQKAVTTDADLSESMKDVLLKKITEIGENIVVRRGVKFAVQGTGLVASYIHLGGKVGVLIEVGCGKAETVQSPDFRELVKDLTLHIAACSPRGLDRASIPAAIVAAEREIYAKQVQGKPAQILEKIVDGKMNKFYQQNTLTEQPFVKDPNQSVTQVIDVVAKKLGDSIAVRRYVRYQMGEAID